MGRAPLGWASTSQIKVSFTYVPLYPHYIPLVAGILELGSGSGWLGRNLADQGLFHLCTNISPWWQAFSSLGRAGPLPHLFPNPNPNLTLTGILELGAGSGWLGLNLTSVYHSGGRGHAPYLDLCIPL